MDHWSQAGAPKKKTFFGGGIGALIAIAIIIPLWRQFKPEEPRINRITQPYATEAARLARASMVAAVKAQKADREMYRFRTEPKIMKKPWVDAALKQAEKTRSLTVDAIRRTELFTAYVLKHRDQLQGEGMSAFVSLVRMYKHPVMREFLRAMLNMLDREVEMLRYAKSNWGLESPQKAKRLMDLLNRYDVAVKKYRAAASRRNKFVQDLANRDPVIRKAFERAKRMMTGARH